MASASIDVEWLESYVVNVDAEDKPATEIVSTEDLGRVVVATKDFLNVGEVILREKPLLVWDNQTNGTRQYLDAFLDAPAEVQNLVLDMHTPPESSQYMKSLRSTALNFCNAFPRYSAVLGVDKMVKLIGVSNINAHEYNGRPPEAFYDVVSEARRLSSGRSALFAYGSKVAHSCCSNATYTSKTSDGCLEYKVIAPIRGGGVISFPYIDNNPSVPTHHRREELMATKVFFCECEKCSGLDYARLHSCPSKCCSGKVSCVKPKEDSDTIWLCTECGPV